MTNHDAAMDVVRRACDVTTLSYEEAVAVYLRARGILNDGAEALGAPVPSDWRPPSFNFDKAWSEVIADDSLKSIRSRISVADLRQLIEAISKAVK